MKTSRRGFLQMLGLGAMTGLLVKKAVVPAAAPLPTSVPNDAGKYKLRGVQQWLTHVDISQNDDATFNVVLKHTDEFGVPHAALLRHKTLDQIPLADPAFLDRLRDLS